MNHADPETMRARARQAVDFLKQQLVRTGTIEPLVAFYFADHIEQVQFEDPSILAPRGASNICARWRESTSPKQR